MDAYNSDPYKPKLQARLVSPPQPAPPTGRAYRNFRSAGIQGRLAHEAGFARKQNVERGERAKNFVFSPFPPSTAPNNCKAAPVAYPAPYPRAGRGGVGLGPP
jgi:hypothetical protein